MSDGSRLADLEDVLDALVATKEGPGRATLHDWVREYPQFERELVDFMASWTLMNSAATSNLQMEPTGINAGTDERLMLRGMSIVQNLLHTMPHQAEAPPHLDSLLGAAKAAGMDLADVAQTTHLGEAVVRKLDRRLIRFSSIPRKGIDAIANAIRCQAESVATYLQQPPTFSPRALYRADRVPQLSEPEDFLAAVEKDPTMTPEDRRLWRDAVGEDQA